MKINKRCLSIVVMILTLYVVEQSYALEVTTHEAINSRVADLSGLSNGDLNLNDYLKDNLGLPNGLQELVKDNKTVQQWLELGGRYEDKPPWTLPYLRSVNHFHNPITDSGYSGIFGGLLLSGESSIQWAQKPKGTQSPGGRYSWYDARDYFHKALTSADKTQRENYFAETFRGLGQLMHLVQDASVPGHTRDDGHLFYNYETFVKEEVDVSGSTPYFFNKSILSSATGLPISNIFDTNQYEDGSSPDVTVGNAIGLAEYTNANFFSEDTINASTFTYPRIDENTPVVERQYTTIIGTPGTRNYYLKNCCGETNGGNGYLLAAVDFLDDWRQEFLGGGLSKVVVLDDNVYKDYAELLIPRAVGYSAGLLDYFFRGEMDLVPVPDNQNHYVIKNESETENMEGDFYLYYDAENDIRKELAHWTKEEVGKIVNGASSGTVSFTPPTDAKTDGEYVLVFEGRLGNEQGAVVGKVVKHEEEVEFQGSWLANLDEYYEYGPYDVSVDSTGVYVAGRGWYDRKWQVMKLAPSTGSVIWSFADDRQFFIELILESGDSYPRATANIPHKVVADPDSNGIYIAGNDAFNARWNLQKRDPETGSTIWTTREWWGEHVNSIAADMTGIYAVVGGRWEGAGNWCRGGTTWHSQKNDFSDGDLIWKDDDDEGSSYCYKSWDKARDVAADSSGVYIVGIKRRSAPPVLWRMEKMLDKSLIWQAFSDFEGDAYSVAVSSTGVYIVGIDYDAWVWRIQKRGLNDGALLWSVEGPALDGWVRDIAADSSGVYIVHDKGFQKIDPDDGSLMWISPGSFSSVDVDSSGLYIAGGEIVMKVDPAVGGDADGDRILDFYDNCKDVSNYSQYDNDDDGVGNHCDNCFNVDNPDQEDTDSDGSGDACDNDDDNDGIDDTVDNCPLIANPDQTDMDGDGIGDACDPDDDGDGIDDEIDNCPLVSSPDQTDSDGDGLGNVCDNCPDITNPEQADFNNDGTGDACDTDDDGDGFEDAVDNCPLAFNPNQKDNDSDGAGDMCDTDDDNDGINDDSDNCPMVSNPDQIDSNGNGRGDACGIEVDADLDGIPDDSDNCKDIPNYNQYDFDKDGVGNPCDNCFSNYNPEQTDSDADGSGDECDYDDDGDGVPDPFDNCPLVPNPYQSDTNGNGIGDACETPGGHDSDLDGIPDAFDNCPMVPNPGQMDTDGDGIGDACEIPGGFDSDMDGVPDAFDNCPMVPNPDQLDTDRDGVGDACEGPIPFPVP